MKQWLSHTGWQVPKDLYSNSSGVETWRTPGDPLVLSPCWKPGELVLTSTKKSAAVARKRKGKEVRRRQTIFLFLCPFLCLCCHQKVPLTFGVDLSIPIKMIKTVPQLGIPAEMIQSCTEKAFKPKNHHVQIKHIIYSINRLNGKK